MDDSSRAYRHSDRPKMPNGPSAADGMRTCFEGAERSDHALAISLEPAKDWAGYVATAQEVPS